MRILKSSKIVYLTFHFKCTIMWSQRKWPGLLTFYLTSITLATGGVVNFYPRCCLQVVLTSTHNVCFGSKTRKLGTPLQTAVFFFYIKVGFKGLYIAWTCFPDDLPSYLLPCRATGVGEGEAWSQTLL